MLENGHNVIDMAIHMVSMGVSWKFSKNTDQQWKLLILNIQMVKTYGQRGKWVGKGMENWEGRVRERGDSQIIPFDEGSSLISCFRRNLKTLTVCSLRFCIH